MRRMLITGAMNESIRSLTEYVTALPTPFAGARSDVPAFARPCAWQIEEGVAALVVNGTTGVAPTRSVEEQRR